MESKFQRQTAIKIKISDLNYGKNIFENEKFVALETNGKRIIRVNVIGNVVDKYSNEEKQYASLTLDDGSGQIRLKGFSDLFSLLNQLSIGETLYVIGLLRFFNGELYITPEIIKNVNPKWLLLRQLELEKESLHKKNNLNENLNNQIQAMQKSSIQTNQEVAFQKIGNPIDNNSTSQTSIPSAEERIKSPKLIVLNIIKKKKEIDFEELVPLANQPLEEIKTAIKELIGEGEIYESYPGHLCAME